MRTIKFLLLILLLFTQVQAQIEEPSPPLFAGSTLEQAPCLFKGRFRPLQVCAGLWLADFYGAEQLSKKHMREFSLSTRSATELWIRMSILGHEPFDDSPFFAIRQIDIKEALNLAEDKDHFSYGELRELIFEDPESNKAFLLPILQHAYLKAYFAPANRGRNQRFELSELAEGLWVEGRDGQVKILQSPSEGLWSHFDKGTLLFPERGPASPHLLRALRPNADARLELLQKILRYEQMSSSYGSLNNAYLEAGANDGSVEAFSLQNQIRSLGNQLQCIPSKKAGDWISLRALSLPLLPEDRTAKGQTPNFSAYSDPLFEGLLKDYQLLESSLKQLSQNRNSALERKIHNLSLSLGKRLLEGYQSIEGQVYREAEGKNLSYPSQAQLEAESAYHKYPIMKMALGLYLLAVLLSLGSLWTGNRSWTRAGLLFIAVGFILHSFVLALRCYILERPPVSNMTETVIYVPWIAVGTGLALYKVFKTRLVPFAAAIGAIVLLTLLEWTQSPRELENVQAVLDSQFWLVIHVLMIVASYGIFILGGILAHIYLAGRALYGRETQSLSYLIPSILQSLYIGTALIIPGLILGGVWAAESWGRFWDWDPKESWALISSCLYLIVIHSYRYGKIRAFGLAVGAVFGLLAISFTWYGVNYILGTGLHSYGFGQGGEQYYYLYILSELLFLTAVSILRWKNENQLERRQS